MQPRERAELCSCRPGAHAVMLAPTLSVQPASADTVHATSAEAGVLYAVCISKPNRYPTYEYES